MQPAIYILTNKWNCVLYTGVTADLQNRLRVHRTGLNPHGFTARYNVWTLVYYELHPTMLAAIAREKQIKGGSRADKLRLIERMNPEWADLGGLGSGATGLLRPVAKRADSGSTGLLRRGPQRTGSSQ